MPATTPEEIHRLFEDAFNAGDNVWGDQGAAR
jgi:hypothetical protein